MAVLSGDVLLVILDFLKEDASSHNTLFQCALASRWFAEPALSILYESYDSSPVFGGGSEDIRFTHGSIKPRSLVDSSKSTTAFFKWVLMWKSIILSTSESKTFLPYCHYIRYLDLDDLRELLTSPSFTKTSVRDDFYSSGIGDLVYQDYEIKGHKRLRSAKDLSNTAWVIDRVGTLIIENTHMIRELKGNMSGRALKEWVAHMPNLKTLDLLSGASFSERAEESIREHCPGFKTLSLFRWRDHQDVIADVEAERVLNNLRPDSLETFETISSSFLGPRTVVALGCHINSLQKLTMTGLSEAAIAQFSTLGAPKALRTLVLTDSAFELNEITDDHDPISAIAPWICQCENLRYLRLRKFIPKKDGALLSRVLGDERIRLEALTTFSYLSEDSRDFYHALSFQASCLRNLSIEGERGMSPWADDYLVQAICKLSELRSLHLTGSSRGPLDPENTMTLAQHLTKLERLIFSGADLHDYIWPSFLPWKFLRFLSFQGSECYASTEGIIEFASTLSPTNTGFYLTITGITTAYIPIEQQNIISDVLEQNVGGTFEYAVIEEEDNSDSEESFVSD